MIPAGRSSHGWGVPIGTDTAFAVALIMLLGDRVPIELRVFLTAAVMVDDIVGDRGHRAVLHAASSTSSYLVAAGRRDRG